MSDSFRTDSPGFTGEKQNLRKAQNQPNRHGSVQEPSGNPTEPSGKRRFGILNRFIGFSARLSPSPRNIHGGFAVRLSGGPTSILPAATRKQLLVPVIGSVRSGEPQLVCFQNLSTAFQVISDRFCGLVLQQDYRLHMSGPEVLRRLNHRNGLISAVRPLLLLI